MGKTLNTNSITNELENSSFFPGRPTQSKEQESPKRAAPQRDVVQPVKPAAQPVISELKEHVQKPVAQPASPAPAASRRYIRRTFDIYEEQLAYLNRASLEERLAGGDGSMNAMVREALDAFIENRKRKS